MPFKNARKTQDLRILRGKLNQNRIFCVQIFFKIVLFRKFFCWKSCFLKIIFSSKSCFLGSFFSWKTCFLKIYSSSNLTRCRTFNSKSDALYFFQFRIRNMKIFSIQNLLFKSCFQILAELLSKWYKEKRVAKWQLLCVKGFFMSVWHVFVSQLVQFFADCILYGNGVLDGCFDYIICTTNWFIQIFLDFRKWLVYKDFVLEDTKLLAYLSWPSRKQFTIFISSNSNLVFLTFSILSAKTDPIVCVDLVFW